MVKKFLFVLSLVIMLPSYAFEDCIICSDAKFSNIDIEDNDIIDVSPIFTVMNDKNTLFVQPIKSGETNFSVLKDGKNKLFFHVVVSEDATKISGANGCDIFVLDFYKPRDYVYDNETIEDDIFKELIDLPPVLGGR